MLCDDVRTSLSALLDDGEPVIDPAIVRIHLRGCAHCRRFASTIVALDEEINRSSRRFVGEHQHPMELRWLERRRGTGHRR
jgi:predicted anti-sigma-YlaC factor YlaD